MTKCLQLKLSQIYLTGKQLSQGKLIDIWDQLGAGFLEPDRTDRVRAFWTILKTNQDGFGMENKTPNKGDRKRARERERREGKMRMPPLEARQICTHVLKYTNKYYALEILKEYNHQMNHKSSHFKPWSHEVQMKDKYFTPGIKNPMWSYKELVPDTRQL